MPINCLHRKIIWKCGLNRGISDRKDCIYTNRIFLKRLLKALFKKKEKTRKG